MKLTVPLLLTVSAGATQLVVLKSVFCCRLKPVEGAGQETTAVLVEVRKIFSSGAPGVCSAKRAQNPPMLADRAADGINAARAGAAATGDFIPVDRVALGAGAWTNQKH